MFPTKLHNGTNEMSLGCFIVDGDYAKKVNVDFSPMLTNEDKQFYVYPNLIDINGETYIFYSAKNVEHGDPNDRSEIRMSKVTFITEGYATRV